MTKTLVNPEAYSTLLAAIRAEIADAEKDIENRLIRMYWGIGKHISQEILKNKDRAAYGKKLYARLSESLNKATTTLYRAVRFYEMYPNLRSPVKSASSLSWTHYELLTTVDNKAERTRLEKKVIREKLPTRALRVEVKKAQAREVKKADAPVKPPRPVPTLASVRGKLFCFGLVPAEKEGGRLMLDLGFRMRRDFPQARKMRLSGTDCVRLVSSKGKQSFAKVTLRTDELFTYTAIVRNIIDGDTIWVMIDVGQGLYIKQKLRLRGIDCPGIDTPEGIRAKQFVEQELRGCGFVVIKTHRDKSDKYDRYLADVFYCRDERNANKVAEEGALLNQCLLDKGLAKIMKR